MVGRGRDGEEAVNLRAAHQQLQRDPRPEAVAGTPDKTRALCEVFDIVQNEGGIFEFTNALIILTLAAAYATRIVAKHAEPMTLEHLIQHDGDRILHRAARFRVRMED